MLSKREKQILKLLKEGDCLNAKEIGDKTGVSSRTIRSDIATINQKMEGTAEILSFAGTGYQLQIQDESSLQNSLDDTIDEMPENKEDRVDYILSLFLKQNGYIKIEDIAKQLYQSERTISLDLQEVRRQIQKYDLTIINRPKYGMQLQGDEKKAQRTGKRSASAYKATSPGSYTKTARLYSGNRS